MDQNNYLEAISIRLLHSVEELTRVKELEEIVWADDDPIPIHQTVTAVKNGGLVLGAFQGNRLIGFQYSFAGFDGERVYLCSHTLGIDPQFRGKGIGEKLKWAQRAEAIRKGYQLVTWTYDPLETANGNLNIRKLGAVCSRYLENCYGEMSDILNAGIPSDRFQVDWFIASERVSKALNQVSHEELNLHKRPPLIQISMGDHGFAVPGESDLTQDGAEGKLFVPVPTAFQTIKEHDLQLALEWRLRTREVFIHYFASGWQVSDFVRGKGSIPVHYYVLEKVE